MKKILVAILCTIFLVGCGNTSTPTKEQDKHDTTLTVEESQPQSTDNNTNMKDNEETPSNKETTVKNKEITLDFAFGTRTGKYSGPLDASGLPTGIGKFTTTNSEGSSWTYEGAFVNGHFQGEGQVTWDNGYFEKGNYKDDVVEPMADSKIPNVYSNPDDYKGYVVSVYGRVFNIIDDSSFQMNQNIEDSTNNTVVTGVSTASIHDGDIVKINGTIGGSIEYQNAFQATLSAVLLYAKDIEQASYMDAVRPAIRTISVEKTQTQLGYSVTVEKVEFAEEETRVYLSVENNGKSKFSLFDSSAEVEQNNRQYETQYNFLYDYPQLTNSLRVGNKTDGIVVFPALQQESFMLYITGYSDDYNERLEEYAFEIEVEPIPMVG